MRYQAIIFDLDGTLIDSMQLWRQVDVEFLTKRGIDVPADLFDNIPGGNGFIQTALYFKERFGLDDSVESIMDEWTDMVGKHYSSDVKLKEGVYDLLQTIRENGIKIGLATSNSLHLAQTVLQANGVLSWFSAFSTGDMELRGKPYPDIFLNCAKLLGVEPEACLAVEDTLTGVQAAKAAGMRTFAIFDEDSIPFWPQIKEVADLAFEDYTMLAGQVKMELGLTTRR
ncbi:MAG: HAD family hydrolase [Candidatus Cloacimonadaceae bacterium]|jgi:HAD superfamily hydrolase (TIGR01509 family)